jgi:hypothetical protein
MPGSQVKLGPYSGGINSLSDEGSVAPNELVDCTNYDVMQDGTLRTRPPITSSAGKSDWSSNSLMLGYFVLESAAYLIASASGGIYRQTLGGATWSTVTTAINSEAMVQYQNKAYFINNNLSVATGGGSWDGTTYSAVANIPTGRGGIAFKDRLWVWKGLGGDANSSRLYYSKPTDFTVWTVPDGGFIDIGPGDGQYITAVIPVNDVLIIFKNASTWVLSFTGDPGSGNLRQISTTVGANNRFATAKYENSLYVLYQGKVYEIVNYQFTIVNAKVPFSYSTTTPTPLDARFSTFLSVIGDRLLVRYFNNVYVYSIRSDAWVRWVTSQYFGPFVRSPVAYTSTDNIYYAAGSALSSNTLVYRFIDGFVLNVTESMTSTIRTRNYDFDRPDRYKRLFWWGGDVGTFEAVVGAIVIVTAAFKPTHRDLAQFTHAQLKGNSQSNPLQLAIIQTPVDNDSATIKRRFIKFLRPVRFRTCYFTLSVGSDGSIYSEFYSIRLYVSLKERVVHQVT